VRFRSKELERKDNNEYQDMPSCDQAKLEQFKGEVRRKVKYWKEKKEWDRVRSMNVDSIINRNCRTFEELIGEYIRRIGLPEGKRVFVFESKDLWMKRVLIDRGWV
jgi:hypothetical protein